MSRILKYSDVKHEPGVTDDPMKELTSFITKGEFTLLAHLDSGVRWGSCKEGKLVLAPDFPDHKQPVFIMTALQQLRVFNSQSELFLWRKNSAQFGWRKTTDVPGESAEYFDEDTLLWGTHIEDHLDGFTLLREGAQGMRHTPPLSMPTNTNAGSAIESARLVIRHYLNSEPTATITVSRLVELKPLKAKHAE